MRRAACFVVISVVAGSLSVFAAANESAKAADADTTKATAAAVSAFAKTTAPRGAFRDFSEDTERQTVIAAGTKTVYQGHPTTLLMPDGKTIYCVWSTGHGGPAGAAAVSEDGGLTWKRIDDRFPEGFRTHEDCPSIYNLKGPDGRERLWIWSAYRKPTEAENKAAGAWYKARMANAMPSVMSEDGGLTWKEMSPLGQDFACIMAFCGVERLKDGSYLGVFHRNPEGRDRPPLSVWQAITRDGGFTWSKPEMICDRLERCPCEPTLIRSPDGNELCCLMRSNKNGIRSLMSFSRDEGKKWTPAEDTPAGLTGHRHIAARMKDGRYFVAFRAGGGFCAWVGPYEAIRSGTGKDVVYVKLLKQHKGGDSETRSYWRGDCGYPGVSVLPDGTVVAVTYVQYKDGDELRSIVAVRLRPDDLRP